MRKVLFIILVALVAFILRAIYEVPYCIGVVSASLIIGNIYATYRCIRSPYADKKQKLYQIVFVWLIPVVGAVTVCHFSKSEKPIESNGGNSGHTSYDPSSASSHGDGF